jgi:UDP-N-acetylmuramoyl-L-alanyl-D-glutamate--2,6-diaminopimelate ligase
MTGGVALLKRPAWSLRDLLADFFSPSAAAGPGSAGLESTASSIGDILAEAGAGDLVVIGLSLDSRRLQPGWLFLACRGTRGHGLGFAAEARARGAIAIAAELDDHWDPGTMARLSADLGLPVVPLSDLRRQASRLAGRFFGDPSAYLEVLGVTGTNGKTSVTHYLAQALAGEVPCGVIGTLGAGFPGDLQPCTHTTPDPVSLQETLAWLRERNAGAVAMEVSSHALDQGRTSGVRFTHGIFTNLSRDHLDYHGDMARYAAAKRELFRYPGLGWAILNLDDALSADILGDLAPGVRAGGFTLDKTQAIPARCEVWVRLLALVPGHAGMRLELDTSGGPTGLELGIIGRFNAANALAVFLVLLSRGMDLDAAQRAMAQLRGVPGRMERFGGAGAPLVVVDYAHSPDALEQVLRNLRDHARGRLICLFGCGGERDAGKRPLMGEVAERLADQVILTDDNPRGESGDTIIAQILSGMDHPSKAIVERRRGLAIRRAIAIAGRDDLVLVAGKGHETVQDLGDRKVHFSDRAQVQQALGERIWAPALEVVA